MVGTLISNGIATYGLYGTLAPMHNRGGRIHAIADRILQRLMQQSVDIVRRDRNRVLHLAEQLFMERVMTPEGIEAAWQHSSDPGSANILEQGSAGHA